MKQKTSSNTPWRFVLTAVAMIMLLAACGRSGSDLVSDLRKETEATRERAINNNILQLVAVADQFYLETGKTTASFADIVGATKYAKRIQSVDGETYPTSFKKGELIVVT